MAGQTLEKRFWPKVDATEGCWWWKARGSQGYGHINEGGRGRPLGAHRVAYELCFGPIPEDMDLDHLCSHRNCVNPFHLEVVTRGENTRRGNVGRVGIKYRKRAA